jgi:hypothetical protein
MSFPTLTPQDCADVVNGALASVATLASDATLGITQDKAGVQKLLTLLFLSGIAGAHTLASGKAAAANAAATQAASNALTAAQNSHQTQQAAVQVAAAGLLP